MLKHHVVWHPEKEQAFHAVTAVAAKALACRDAAREWHQLLVEGWRISMVEDSPGPALPAHE
jgi:hypothetical protein